MANANPLVIYNANSSGICAAVAAARMGAKVKLLEPYDEIGGVISRGALAQTDRENTTVARPNDALRYSLSKEIYERWGAEDGRTGNFFPSMQAAQRVFNQMIANEPNITLVKNAYLDYPTRDGVTGRVTNLRCNGVDHPCDNAHDAGDEGDLAFKLGCLMDVGREGSAGTGRPTAGVRPPLILSPGSGQGPLGYNPANGQRYPGLMPRSNQALGSADRRLMAFMTRTIMTQDPDRVQFANLLPGVTPNKELYRADLNAAIASGYTTVPASIGQALAPLEKVNAADNHAFEQHDANNGNLFRIGLNDIGAWLDWSGLTWPERFAKRDAYLLLKAGLFKTICTDAEWASALPALVADTKTWGLVPGLFPNSIVPGMSPYPYIRNMRRIRSMIDVTMEQWIGETNVPEPLFLYGYPNADAHWYQRMVLSGGRLGFEGGAGLNDGFEPKTALMPFGAIKARRTDCRNLTVSRATAGTMLGWIISRIELVYMKTGEVGGITGALAQLANKDSCDVSYTTELRPQLITKGFNFTF